MGFIMNNNYNFIVTELLGIFLCFFFMLFQWNNSWISIIIPILGLITCLLVILDKIRTIKLSKTESLDKQRIRI